MSSGVSCPCQPATGHSRTSRRAPAGTESCRSLYAQPLVAEAPGLTPTLWASLSLRVAHRADHLLQFRLGLTHRADVAALIGAHAVADHRNADGLGAVEHAVVAELGMM